jgi:Zn-dependent peptidase ImmA (M78 family)
MTGATAASPAATRPKAGLDSELSTRLRVLGLAQPDEIPTGLLGRLRTMVPQRPLGWREAEQLAERQANRLRGQLDVLGPQLREEDVAALPWLTITRRGTLPTSGLATKTDFGWLIVIKGDEPMVRQRFSWAHELKHILDDGLIDQLPAGLYPSVGGYSQHERAERVCDRFAAALLMPKPMVRADWADGLQDIAKLAKRYDVSRAAMRIRLSQLGLLAATPRCAGPATPSTTTTGEPT